MKKDLEILRNCALFNGIETADLETMLDCLKPQENTFKKGETIISEGESAKYIGIVLSGKVQIERVDYYGNRSILTTIEPSKIFGESFACANLKQIPVNVIAVVDSRVLLIDAMRITKSCCNACNFHSQIIFNLLNIVAKKNLAFHQKIEITSKRTTREKLMTYLLMEAKQTAKNSFSIPFNRQELADYLEVERSGLSAEISKLRNEKVLISKKNTFTLL